MPYSTWAPTTVTWETWWMVLGENKFSCSIIQRITSPFSWNYCSIWVIFQAVCRERLHRINKKLSLHSIWKQGLLKVLSKINQGQRDHVPFLGKSLLFLLQYNSTLVVVFVETLLPHLSPSEDGQNAWNQNYTYIFEVIDIIKPNINDDEINTSNVRAGFSKINWLCSMRDRVKARQKKVSKTRFDTEGPC